MSVDAVVWRGILAEGDARVFVTDTTLALRKLRDLHNLSPTASAALGRLLSACVMMTVDQKVEDARITLRIEGSGKLGVVVADAEREGFVRGYVKNPSVDLDLDKAGKIDVSKAIGLPGTLTVIKDIGLKSQITSQVPLVSGEIGEDIAFYYYKSEQLPTAIALGVRVSADPLIKTSGGLMLQILPGTNESTVLRLEQRFRNVKSISKLIEESDDLREMVNKILDGESISWKEEVGFVVKCRCSYEVATRLLLTMNQRELEQHLKEGKVEVKCHFCGKVYEISKDDIKKALSIVKSKKNKKEKRGDK